MICRQKQLCSITSRDSFCICVFYSRRARVQANLSNFLKTYLFGRFEQLLDLVCSDDSTNAVKNN